jgi:group I intron endonuclease
MNTLQSYGNIASGASAPASIRRGRWPNGKTAPLCGVYCIISKTLGRVIYVGSSTNVKHRWRQHRHSWKVQELGTPLLMKHAAQYGVSDLSFELVEDCEQPKLLERELHYIQAYQTSIEHGGCNTNPDPTKPYSAFKGKTPWNKGRAYSEEERRAISERSKIALADPERRRIMSEKKKGHKPWNTGIKTGLIPHNARPVTVYDMDMQLIGQYPTARHAAADLNCCFKKISVVCQRKRKHHLKMIFRFSDEQ